MEHEECPKIREQLVEYLEGSLARDQVRLVEKHMTHCWDCRYEAELLDLSWGALDTWKDTEPSVLFRARFWKKVDDGAAAIDVETEAQQAPARVKPAWKFALPKLPAFRLFPAGAAAKRQTEPGRGALKGLLLFLRPPAWAVSLLVVAAMAIGFFAGGFADRLTPHGTPPTRATQAPATAVPLSADQDASDIDWSLGSTSIPSELPAYVDAGQTKPYIELNFKSGRLLDHTHDLLSEMI